MPNFNQNTALQQLANLELLAKQVVEGFVTGMHKSPFHGFSVEFAEHRLYNNGESVKNVDWKLLARTDKMFVKQFEEETNLRCYLLLDTSASMNYPPQGLSKLQFSVYAIASLMYLFKKQRDAFGLGFFNQHMEWLSPARSTSAHLFYLFAQLEKRYNQPLAGQGTNIAQVLHHVAEDVHQRSMIVLFSDMLEPQSQNPAAQAELFAALQHLKYNRHEVIIFNVCDKTHELDFNFDNRPYHFIDLEQGEELRLHPAQIKQSYIAAMSSYRQQLLLKCAQYKIDMTDAFVEDGYTQVLKTYLSKRQQIIR